MNPSASTGRLARQQPTVGEGAVPRETASQASPPGGWTVREETPGHAATPPGGASAQPGIPGHGADAPGAESGFLPSDAPSDASRSLAGALAPRLALLRALAVDGHVTRAAQRIGVPQPTVSRWLAALAGELGAPVVVRDGRGVRLTRAGEYLASAAGHALSALEGGCRQAIEEVDPDRGQVVLAFLHTMGESRVPNLLRAFRQEHPRVRFTLLQGAQEDVLGQVRSGQADLALTSPSPAGSEFSRASLDEQPLVATVPAGHRLAKRARVRLAQLAGEPFVGMKQGYGLRQITDELCRAAGFTPELAFEGEEVDTVRGLVAAGLGVAILPVAEQSLPPGAVEVPLAQPASREIVLVWAAGRPLAPAARAFREFALARLARTPARPGAGKIEPAVSRDAPPLPAEE